MIEAGKIEKKQCTASLIMREREREGERKIKRKTNKKDKEKQRITRKFDES